MEIADLNGGNAEMVCEGSNLETVEQSEKQPEKQSEEQIQETEHAEQEINGDSADLSKNVAASVRRTLRKTKANSTSTVEAVESDAKPKMKGRKRKLSEPDINSEDSMDFTGFDTHCFDNCESGSLVLQKLIAEVELSVVPKAKRGRPSRKRLSDIKPEDISNVRENTFMKEPKVEPKVEPKIEPMEAVNNAEAETPYIKTEELIIESPVLPVNSSPQNTSAKSRGARSLQATSPLTGKPKVDLTNPAFQEPFKHGWKRELVYRGAMSDTSIRKMADIYYISPKGKKIRSYKEMSNCLTPKDTLKVENFTFHKEPIGINDPEKEIIRDARKVKDNTPIKSPAKKIATSTKKSPMKKTENSSLETPAVTKSTPNKTIGKSAKSTPTGQKGRPPKKALLKKETKQQKQLEQTQASPPAAVSEAKENDMLTPQRNSPATRRNQQVVEKTVSPKAKRVLKTKVLEPCSIRCSTSMGQIPSLQCSVCLCLYHPECVHVVEYAGNYVCENCRQDSGEIVSQLQPLNSSLTPPPLIPISMLNTSGLKSKHQGNAAPPKLQRIPKCDGSDANLRIVSKHLKQASGPLSSTQSDKKEGTRFIQNENEFLPSFDGIVPKPAQNIATMAGKRYIIIPKNNSMAVQPAITVKQDKIGDKPPSLPNNSSINSFNVTENKIFSQPAPIVEQSEKTVNNQHNNEALIENLYENYTGDQKVDKLDDLKSNPTDTFKDASKEITEPQKESPNAMETELNELLENNLPTELSEACKSSEVETSVKKKLKRLEPKSRRASQNKLLTNGTLQGNFVTQNSNIVDDFTTTAILNIARAGIKKKQIQAEADQRQHFMVSVCAGYHALSKVFQYLKVKELLRAARVCKMWRDLAAHPSLWKTVRMKNSPVTDWDGFAETLKRRGTQHLDMRKILVFGEFDTMWKKFVAVIPRVNSLVKLELCRCSEVVVEEVIKNCPQLEVLSALTIKCDALNLDSVGNLQRCRELRLKSVGGMHLQGDLLPLQEMTQLTHLSLTSIKELGKKKLEVLQSLSNLETLELGECSDFPEKFGTEVLVKLSKLERLRLEKGQGLCCTFDILEGVSRMENLSQLELVNFDVKNGFDKCLAKCANIKRLLIIPTYISQSATSNNMVLAGVIELSQNLTHFVWGVTLELLRVTELFVDQCNKVNKPVSGESIPVLKPVPCLKLIQEVEDDVDSKTGEEKQPSVTNPQVDILPLSQLQKLLLTALPKTRVKILKIPFNATWRQNISDTTVQ